MPISSFYGLQTSLRGLLAQQRSLDTTSHNIANASTPGFSRQEAVLTAAPATDVPAGMLQHGGGAQIGAGVDVQAYRRVRDNFLDLQFRGQNSVLGEQNAKSEALDRAELTLAEPGENGISKRLSEFWDAWSALAGSPSDPAAQGALLAKGAALADAFASVKSQLELGKADAAAEYADLTRASGPGVAPGEIEATARELAGLNDTIKKFVTAGDTPNDLMDKRDALLDKLAGYGQVSTTANADGTIDVAFGGVAAPPLVAGSVVNWSGPPAGWTPGGRLGGLLSISQPGGAMDSFVTELDTIANTVITNVNAALAVDGAPPFFSGNSADTMAVDPAAKAAPGTLGGGPGAAADENSAARRVEALRGGAGDQSYRSFVARMGTEVADADRKTANAQVLVDSVEDRRQSVAGVSLDEEMSNLVRFQRAYQASARAMSTMDEMLDVLINRTGRVGL
jgi:flagellar hook-associated protein 1 FlgK